MFAILSCSITPSTLRDLLNFAAANGSPEAAAGFADQAIREWLDRAGPVIAASPPARGYQWKDLFLPAGTQLRVWSRDAGSAYAEVVGDDIIHAGQRLTPNQLVRRQRGIPRNAWTEIWLLLPGETVWKAAHVRRDEQRRSGRALRDAQPQLPSPPAPPPGPAAGVPHSVSATAKPGEPVGACQTLAQAQRLPRVPPIASQARIHSAQAANAGEGHWWPGAPERRMLARRAEDAFLD